MRGRQIQRFTLLGCLATDEGRRAVAVLLTSAAAMDRKLLHTRARKSGARVTGDLPRGRTRRVDVACGKAQRLCTGVVHEKGALDRDGGVTHVEERRRTASRCCAARDAGVLDRQLPVIPAASPVMRSAPGPGRAHLLPGSAAPRGDADTAGSDSPWRTSSSSLGPGRRRRQDCRSRVRAHRTASDREPPEGLATSKGA